MAALRSRPVLAAPLQMLTARSEEIHRARTAARRDINRLVAAETDRIGHLSARLATLGPAATLARGYAVVQAMPEGEPAVVLRRGRRRTRRAHGYACGCPTVLSAPSARVRSCRDRAGIGTEP